MQPLALRPGAQRVPPKRIQPSLLAFLRPINGPDESNKEGLNFIARDSKEEEIKKKPCVQERALKSVERSTGEKARIIVDLECPIVSEPGLKKKPAARRAPVRGVDYIADSEDEEEGPLVLRQARPPTNIAPVVRNGSPMPPSMTAQAAAPIKSWRPRAQAPLSSGKTRREASAPQRISSPSSTPPPEFPGFQTETFPELPAEQAPFPASGSHKGRQAKAAPAGGLEQPDAQVKETRMTEAQLRRDPSPHPSNESSGLSETPGFKTPQQRRVTDPSGENAARFNSERPLSREAGRVDATATGSAARPSSELRRPAVVFKRPVLQVGSRLREARRRARESDSGVGTACDMPSFDLGIDSDEEPGLKERQSGLESTVAPAATGNQEARKSEAQGEIGGAIRGLEGGRKAPPDRSADTRQGSEDSGKMQQEGAEGTSLGAKSSTLGHKEKAGGLSKGRSSKTEKVVGRDAELRRSDGSEVKGADFCRRDGAVDDDIEEFSSPESGPSAAFKRRFSTRSPLTGLLNQSDAGLSGKQETPSFSIRTSTAEDRSHQKNQGPNLSSGPSSTFKFPETSLFRSRISMSEQAPGTAKKLGVRKLSEKLQTARKLRAGVASLTPAAQDFGLPSKGKRPAVDDLFVARERSSDAASPIRKESSELNNTWLSREVKKGKRWPGFGADPETGVVDESGNERKGVSGPQASSEEDEFDLVGGLENVRKRSPRKAGLSEQVNHDAARSNHDSSSKKARAWSPPPPTFSSEEDDKAPPREETFSRTPWERERCEDSVRRGAQNRENGDFAGEGGSWGPEKVANFGGSVRKREDENFAEEGASWGQETEAGFGGSAQNGEEPRGESAREEGTIDEAVVRLLRERLPHYKPLSILMREGGFDNEPIFIDYRNQFMDIPAQGGSGRSYGAKKASGKRKPARQKAGGSDTGDKGRWTTLGGRKVYVDKTGKMLDGRAAYKTHLKDAGVQPKKRRRKSRKKGSRKTA